LIELGVALTIPDPGSAESQAAFEVELQEAAPDPSRVSFTEPTLACDPRSRIAGLTLRGPLTPLWMTTRTWRVAAPPLDRITMSASVVSAAMAAVSAVTCTVISPEARLPLLGSIESQGRSSSTVQSRGWSPRFRIVNVARSVRSRLEIASWRTGFSPSSSGPGPGPDGPDPPEHPASTTRPREGSHRGRGIRDQMEGDFIN
jgi:hypothetical protein